MIAEKNRIEIYSKKKKAFFLLLGSVTFIVLGIFCFMNAENMESNFCRNSLVIKVAGIASVLFFGFGSYVALKQLIRNKLMLIINEDGISLNPEKNKFVKWENIDGFSEIKINGAKIIIIYVNNPEEQINSESNLLRKNLMKFNQSNYGSPFNISVATMNITYNELYKILNENLIKNLKKDI